MVLHWAIMELVDGETVTVHELRSAPTLRAGSKLPPPTPIRTMTFELKKHPALRDALKKTRENVGTTGTASRVAGRLLQTQMIKIFGQGVKYTDENLKIHLRGSVKTTVNLDMFWSTMKLRIIETTTGAPAVTKFIDLETYPDFLQLIQYLYNSAWAKKTIDRDTLTREIAVLAGDDVDRDYTAADIMLAFHDGPKEPFPMPAKVEGETPKTPPKREAIETFQSISTKEQFKVATPPDEEEEDYEFSDRPPPLSLWDTRRGGWVRAEEDPVGGPYWHADTGRWSRFPDNPPPLDDA